MKLSYGIVLMLFSLIMGCARPIYHESNSHAKENTEGAIPKKLYDRFGVIKVADPFARQIDYPADSADVFFIGLRDVGKYHGKVCPGIATGFMMIKQVLDSLFPGGIVQRGLVQVISSKPSDLFDVAGYITGARSFYGRSEINRGDLKIDTTLNPHQYMSFAMVFRRKDNGRAYQVTFHKANLIDPKYRKFIFSVDKKALMGEVSEDTLRKFKKIVKDEVKRTLLHGVRKDVYEIKRLN